MAKELDEVLNKDIESLFTIVGTTEKDAERLDAVPYSYWRETFKQLWKNPLTIICLIVIGLLVFFTIFGPFIQSYRVLDPNKKQIFTAYQLPSWSHLFGIAGANMKEYSYLDLWTLVWRGAQLSLLLGIVVSLIDTVLGIIIGSMWGYFRWLDPILIELRNFISNIPGILLYILLMQFLSPSFWTIVFVLCMFGWMGLAGFIRNQIIIIRNREYNIASQTLGSSPKAMITHNLLPYLVSVIVTVVSTSIPGAISAEVGLAYFGLSFKAESHITLGQLLTYATQDNWLSHPHILIAPMVVIVPLTITFFYLGLVLADATDPKSHR